MSHNFWNNFFFVSCNFAGLFHLLVVFSLQIGFEFTLRGKYVYCRNYAKIYVFN